MVFSTERPLPLPGSGPDCKNKLVCTNKGEVNLTAQCVSIPGSSPFVPPAGLVMASVVVRDILEKHTRGE